MTVIPSPPQATWKDRVNPFKRHGSGSALTVIDTASPVASGVIGVPLCSCQPGTNSVSLADSFFSEFTEDSPSFSILITWSAMHIYTLLLHTTEQKDTVTANSVRQER